MEEFAKLMNNKAKSLNLSHTNFVTPHGLDDKKHYTTAYELALLTNYALKNEQFKNIVNTKTITISVNGVPRTISNTNELLGNLEGVYGVKTGFTFNAGRCLVSSCKRNNLDIIVVVLGADTKNQRTRDSINIINYIYNNFEYVNISDYIDSSFNEYKKYYESHVNLYKTTNTPNIALTKYDKYEFPIKQGTSSLLNTKFYTLNTLSSNIKTTDKIGSMNVYYENQLLCSLEINLAQELHQNTWFYYFFKILKEFNLSFC